MNIDLSKKNYNLRVFIEHVEIIVSQVSIKQVTNSISSVLVTLPVSEKLPKLKQRSLMHIGISDGTEGYILQFVGEITQPSTGISSGGGGASITAYSFDNHWDGIPIYPYQPETSNLPTQGGVKSRSNGALNNEQKQLIGRIMGSSISILVDPSKMGTDLKVENTVGDTNEFSSIGSLGNYKNSSKSTVSKRDDSENKAKEIKKTDGIKNNTKNSVPIPTENSIKKTIETNKAVTPKAPSTGGLIENKTKSKKQSDEKKESIESEKKEAINKTEISKEAREAAEKKVESEKIEGKNNSSESSDKTNNSGSAFPELFINLYTANGFWGEIGNKTGMSKEEKYFVDDGGVFKEFKSLLSYYLAIRLGSVSNNNMNFRTFFNFYRTIIFMDYTLNHSSTTNHMICTAGFSYAIPPKCNVVFPHQFREISAPGKSLATPTRTIGIVSRAAIQHSERILKNAGLIAFAPKVINDIYAATNTLESVFEPITEEEKDKGIIAKQLFVSGFAQAAALAGNIAILQKYLHFYISDIHCKMANSSSLTTIECDYLPKLQSGMPALFFKSNNNDNNNVTYLLGLLKSVNHMIQKGSARTIVTLEYAVQLGMGGHERPIPTWLLNKDLSYFDNVYIKMLGCSSIANYGSSEKNGRYSFDNHIFSAGQKIANEYFTKKNDSERLEYARNFVVRHQLKLEEALNSSNFIMEKKRVSPMKEYKNDVSKYAMIHTTNKLGDDLLAGTLDISIDEAVDNLPAGKKTATYTKRSDGFGSIDYNGAYSTNSGGGTGTVINDALPIQRDSSGNIIAKQNDKDKVPPKGYSGKGAIDVTGLPGNSNFNKKKVSDKSNVPRAEDAYKGWHNDIRTTRFAGDMPDKGDNFNSAYGGQTRTAIGAALPLKIYDSKGRPARIEVYSPQTGKSVVMPLVDLGPMNHYDKNYVLKGDRPATEYGTYLKANQKYAGNKAGLDITPQAARALGLNPSKQGEWQLSWRIHTE